MGKLVLKKLGLRTKIILNITVLVTAALVLTGFLLIKLTERELLEQQVNSVTGTLNVLAHVLSMEDLGKNGSEEYLLERARLFPGALSSGYLVDGWALVDENLKVLVTSNQSGLFSLDLSALGQTASTFEPVLQVHYPESWWPFERSAERFVVVTVSVIRSSHFAGALQARFPLVDVRNRVFGARWLILGNALFSGSVLVVFGSYLLGITVVRPIRILTDATQRVTGGDLETALPPGGPREIAEISGSFNAMTAALKVSRTQAETHIQSLRKTNEELERTRDELVRSEKMASLGHLAAGMAHEIGNPLGALIGYLELLKFDVPPGGSREILSRSLAETERIDRLVRDLLDYAVPEKREREIRDPVMVIAEATDILHHQGSLRESRIQNELPPAMPAVAVVGHKLVQVFVNLLLNARDASSEDGAIRLSGGELGDYVWLAVADSGTGMSSEVQARIFDPFFTTKAPGKGRGLGLSICQRVVEEAGGRIEVRSRAGEGSEFRIWLIKADVGEGSVK